jgi:hypothetical protein
MLFSSGRIAGDIALSNSLAAGLAMTTEIKGRISILRRKQKMNGKSFKFREARKCVCGVEEIRGSLRIEGAHGC